MLWVRLVFNLEVLSPRDLEEKSASHLRDLIVKEYDEAHKHLRVNLFWSIIEKTLVLSHGAEVHPHIKWEE